MKKRTFILLFLGVIVFTNVYSQPKPEIKLIPTKTELTIYGISEVKAYLFNKGTEPIIIFRQDFSEPGWCGVKEKWYLKSKLKTDTIHVMYDAPNSTFKESSIIRVNPGDSLFMERYSFIIKEPGEYSIRYELSAKRDEIIMGYAANEAAKNAALSITEFKVVSPVLLIKCKPVVFKQEQIKELTLSEANTKPLCNSFASAFEAPENVYRFQIGRVTLEELKLIRILKNIHVLILTGICIDDSKSPKDTISLDLTGLSNIKDLNIEGDALKMNVRITSKMLEGLSKLENLHLKKVIFTEPQMNLKNMNSLTILDMTEIDSKHGFSLDIGPSKKFIKIGIYKSYMTQVSTISNIPGLTDITFMDTKTNSIQGVDNLPELKNFTLRGTNVTELPASFSNLPKLHELDLAENQLTTIPKAFGACPVLQFIFLANNKINHLPEELKNLTKVTSIHLEENNYSTLEPVIFQMPALVQLVLTKNNISVLPDNFTQIPKLNILDIRDNKISQLPQSLLALTKLGHLKVSGNPIKEDDTSKQLRKRLKDQYEK
jgi:hypothetical protein